MNEQNFLIVLNPQTGKKGRRCLKKLIAHLQSNCIDFDIYKTVSNVAVNEKKISELIISYSDVISIGGDGTLNMMCNVLVGKNIPLGIIPCGTGNDFTRHIYKKTDDIIETVTNDKTMKVDLGWCNDRYFINVLGVGYDAMIAEKTKNDNKILFRSFFYLWNALKYLPFYKEKNIHITADYFNKNEATFLVAFGNGTFFGNGMNITPEADIADGLLDCCWVGKLSFIKKCICLIKLFSGSHLATHNIEYIKNKRFEILSENQPIEADGEFVGYTPATICIKEKALLLKVP